MAEPGRGSDGDHRNIVLTGFMGTGKSAVGREVARLLGWEFVDMDEVIEARAGKTIPEIFEQQGEATFRRMEADLCAELAQESRIVISTGGGALVSEANYQTMASHGLVVCLDCDLDEIWRRLAASTHRPMLYADDRRARIEELLVTRQPAYDRIPLRVDSGQMEIRPAAERILSYWENVRRALQVRTPTGAYAIHLGRGLLEQAGVLLREANLSGNIGLVSNDVVGPLYAPRLEASLREAGFDLATILLPDGEVNKNLDTARTLYDHFIASGMARDSAVLALGGGVVGDMAGLAAATYMRGIALVQAPTSLLSMVDSSVGGKVAVDHPAGKNLIGAFKQPTTVIADPAVLATLPVEEYRSGLAEMIKHGVIDSPSLFDYFERGGRGDTAWALAEAIRVKIEVVEEDPYEQGRRAVLNLGHTFAHAIELLSDFGMRHGEAVSIGMVAATRTSVALGLAGEGLADRLERCLERHEMPSAIPGYAPEDIWAAMASDKKRRGGKLRFVLPRAIGDVIVTDQVPRETVLEVLDGMRAPEGESS